MPGLILLTGASGYIGSRLLRVLEEGGCAVRCLSRTPARASQRATTEVVAGDCLDEVSLVAAMKGVEQAYYLVHSMASGPGFAALDRKAAPNLGRAAAKAGVQRIIYLGASVRTMNRVRAFVRECATPRSCVRPRLARRSTSSRCGSATR